MKRNRQVVALVLGIIAIVGIASLAAGILTTRIGVVVYGFMTVLLALWLVLFLTLPENTRATSIAGLLILLLLLDQYTYGGPATHIAPVTSYWQIAASITLILLLVAVPFLLLKRAYRRAVQMAIVESALFFALNLFYIARDGLAERFFVVDSASPLPGFAFLVGSAIRVVAITWRSSLSSPARLE